MQIPFKMLSRVVLPDRLHFKVCIRPGESGFRGFVWDVAAYDDNPNLKTSYYLGSIYGTARSVNGAKKKIARRTEAIKRYCKKKYEAKYDTKSVELITYTLK